MQNYKALYLELTAGMVLTAKIYAPYLSEDSKQSHFGEIKPDKSKSNGRKLHVLLV